MFRRARPDDAVDVALATFMACERVDMQALASQLGVSPATLYRWFGSRSRLLDQVCGRVAEQFADVALAASQGEGDERVCDFARQTMVASAAARPVRSFVEREQQVALRLLLRRDSAVHRVLTERTLELMAETRGGETPPFVEDATHLIVQVATGMIWATFLVGDEPDPDTAVEIIRMVLRSLPGG